MDDCWKDMYKLDPYARDRVIKSVRMLLPHLKDGDKACDIGCFTQFVANLLPSSVEYLGVDFQKYHPKTIVVDMNSPSSYCTIPQATHYILLETLEHLLHPGTLLDHLKPSGFLLVSVPNEATLFHRIRCLFGIVDGDCWANKGKHLHLPSLSQTRTLLSKHFEIVGQETYISPSAIGSKQAWVGRILSLVPDTIHYLLADSFPSLFARGFIFLCKHKPTATE